MREAKTIGCKEALRHLLAYLDGELPGVKRQEVERHLSICRACFSRGEFEKRLKERLREARQNQAPSSLEKRIKKLIKQF